MSNTLIWGNLGEDIGSRSMPEEGTALYSGRTRSPRG